MTPLAPFAVASLCEVGSIGDACSLGHGRSISLRNGRAEKRPVAAEQRRQGALVAVVGRPRDAAEGTQPAHVLVAGAAAGENQTQGDQCLVGGTDPDRLQRPIERRGFRESRPFREQSPNRLGLRGRFAKKIAVDEREVHRMRFAAPALALLLAAPATTVAADAPATADLDALLARVRASAGAPFAHNVVSRFKHDDAGRSYDITIETAGYRVLVHRCRNIVCDGAYFDGERMFDLNLNDTALPRNLHDDNDERTLRAVDTGEFAAPDFRATGGTVVELPGVRHEGRVLRRVAVSASGGGPIDVLIDPESALVVATATGDGKVVDEYRDFRKVGELTLPFEIWHAGARERRYDTRTVADAPLAAPTGVVPAFSGASSPIPIQPLDDVRPAGVPPQPVVPCTLGGARALCLLDTGNSSLGISLELAEQLGVEPKGEYDVAGLGNYVTGVVTAGPLRVGNATYPAAKYVVLHDLHDYGYNVVLGADAFARATVTIDFARSTISLGQPGEVTEATSIPLRFTDFLPFVNAQLGAFDALLAIDTGDEAAINVSKSYFDAHPALFAPLGMQEVSGIGGEGRQIVGRLPSVRIGPFEVLHQPIAATDSTLETASGHIGSAFLSNFAAVFDYASARLRLAPRPGDAAVHSIE